MPTRPFDQLPFDDVPDAPRIPHPYFASETRTLKLESAAFGDVDVHVRVTGNGPPLLLVHGLMTSSYSFRYVLAPLGERFTVYAPDLIGSGRSSKPRAHYSPDNMARSIGEMIDALGIRGAPAIGNSMGGYLLMRLALLDPTATSRLVNLHSPGLPTPRMRALSAAFAILPRPAAILGRLIASNPEKWVHKNVHYYDESLKSREEHREYARALTDAGGVEAFASHLSETLAAFEMVRFEEKLTELRRFPIPLELVYAERDPIVPPSVGDRLARLLPDARFERLTRASHFGHVDAPDAFLRVALPFLTTS